MLSLVNVTLAYGGPPLLDAASVELRPGDRLALIGRNGAGKTTLMKVIAGEVKPDAGERITQGSPLVAVLPQDIPARPGQMVGALLEAAVDVPAGGRPELEPWQREARLERALGDLDLAPDAAYDALSSGQKRRVLLAVALVVEPDVLLLDEPTNHLDVESIQAMEEILKKFRGALLLVSHDRAFIQSVASAILDLDRGRLTRWDCSYAAYLERKAEALEAEARQNAVFDKKLAQEEAWIRQGIKARRTRNEGRVRHLKKMREEHRQRRRQQGSVRMDASGGAGASGLKVITAEEISVRWGNEPLFAPFSCEILRGDRVGILGPNGCGKTTLVRTLLGLHPPDTGSVVLGTNLQVAYFDQNREQIDDSLTIAENVAGGNTTVEVAGQRKHVISHLKDFLFTSDRAQAPVHNLSGGERNRLLLARLFTRPFNVLVMDEPTNDLDLETLELLEEQLDAFAGTLILVSHDRAFLDNVVTELLVFEPGGQIRPIVGGYSDYQLFRERSPDKSPGRAPSDSGTPPASAAESTRKGKPAKPRRFLNREQRELDELPARIEALEQEQHAIAEALADPARLRADPTLPVTSQARLAAIEDELNACLARWEELELLKAELEDGVGPA